MKEKEFISYIKGLTDMEISRIKEKDGTPVGYLKLVEEALKKLNKIQYYYSSPTWEIAPTKDKPYILDKQTKQQLND